MSALAAGCRSGGRAGYSNAAVPYFGSSRLRAGCPRGAATHKTNARSQSENLSQFVYSHHRYVELFGRIHSLAISQNWTGVRLTAHVPVRPSGKAFKARTGTCTCSDDAPSMEPLSAVRDTIEACPSLTPTLTHPNSATCFATGRTGSRPRFRSSRCRAGCVLVGLDGCEVRLCDPCARVRPCVPCVCPVCVPAPPGVFFPVPVDCEKKRLLTRPASVRGGVAQPGPHEGIARAAADGCPTVRAGLQRWPRHAATRTSGLRPASLHVS